MESSLLETSQRMSFGKLPSWEQRYHDALEAYARARDANACVTYGGEGIAVRVEAGHAEWDAMQQVDVVRVAGANDFLFQLRATAELFPEDLRDLLLRIVGESIADAVMEAVR